MKTDIQKVCVFVLWFLSFASSSVFASGNHYITFSNFDLWSNTYLDPTIRIDDKDGEQNPGDCTDPDTYFVATSISQEAQNRIYSTLLAAKLSSKPVTAILNDCLSNRPRIISVILK